MKPTYADQENEAEIAKLERLMYAVASIGPIPRELSLRFCELLAKRVLVGPDPILAVARSR